jgi:hypothetical protein
MSAIGVVHRAKVEARFGPTYPSEEDGEPYEYVAWQLPLNAVNIAYWTPLIVCTV